MLDFDAENGQRRRHLESLGQLGVVILKCCIRAEWRVPVFRCVQHGSGIVFGFVRFAVRVRIFVHSHIRCLLLLVDVSWLMAGINNRCVTYQEMERVLLQYLILATPRVAAPSANDR